MKPVYVISSGCIHEGGGVDAVFIRKDLAEAKFVEEVKSKRENCKNMEEFETEEAKGRKDNYRMFEVGFFLKEEFKEEENKKMIIFCGSDYISLRTYNCEE